MSTGVPHSVYFTFQFFNLAPSETAVAHLREISDSSDGSVYLLSGRRGGRDHGGGGKADDDDDNLCSVTLDIDPTTVRDIGVM